MRVHRNSRCLSFLGANAERGDYDTTRTCRKVRTRSTRYRRQLRIRATRRRFARGRIGILGNSATGRHCQAAISGETHVMLLHPGSRRGRYRIDVDGVFWRECGWSESMVKIRKSCKRSPLYIYD